MVLGLRLVLGLLVGLVVVVELVVLEYNIRADKLGHRMMGMVESMRLVNVCLKTKETDVNIFVSRNRNITNIEIEILLILNDKDGAVYGLKTSILL